VFCAHSSANHRKQGKVGPAGPGLGHISNLTWGQQKEGLIHIETPGLCPCHSGGQRCQTGQDNQHSPPGFSSCSVAKCSQFIEGEAETAISVVTQQVCAVDKTHTFYQAVKECSVNIRAKLPHGSLIEEVR
jgi:hypothetical protein